MTPGTLFQGFNCYCAYWLTSTVPTACCGLASCLAAHSACCSAFTAPKRCCCGAMTVLNSTPLVRPAFPLSPQGQGGEKAPAALPSFSVFSSVYDRHVLPATATVCSIYLLCHRALGARLVHLQAQQGLQFGCCLWSWVPCVWPLWADVLLPQKTRGC